MGKSTLFAFAVMFGLAAPLADEAQAAKARSAPPQPSRDFDYTGCHCEAGKISGLPIPVFRVEKGRTSFETFLRAQAYKGDEGPENCAKAISTLPQCNLGPKVASACVCKYNGGWSPYLLQASTQRVIPTPLSDSLKQMNTLEDCLEFLETNDSCKALGYRYHELSCELRSDDGQLTLKERRRLLLDGLTVQFLAPSDPQVFGLVSISQSYTTNGAFDIEAWGTDFDVSSAERETTSRIEFGGSFEAKFKSIPFSLRCTLN